MEASKECVECREIKPLSEFGRHARAKDGLKSHCKLCALGRTRKSRGVKGDTRLRPPVGELCAICRNERKLFLDHDHGTGNQRGWLCTQCNTAIALLGDDPDRAVAAARYLREHAKVKPSFRAAAMFSAAAP